MLELVPFMPTEARRIAVRHSVVAEPSDGVCGCVGNSFSREDRKVARSASDANLLPMLWSASTTLTKASTCLVRAFNHRNFF